VELQNNEAATCREDDE